MPDPYNNPDIEGLTPDEAYAKLVDTARALSGPGIFRIDPHTYALNHLVKRAQEIGYQDGTKDARSTPTTGTVSAAPTTDPAAMDQQQLTAFIGGLSVSGVADLQEQLRARVKETNRTAQHLRSTITNVTDAARSIIEGEARR